MIQNPLNTTPRSSYAQKELTLNALLFVVGALAFLNSLVIAIGSLISGNYCQAERDDDDDNDDENRFVNNFPRFDPRAPPASFSTPPAYFR